MSNTPSWTDLKLLCESSLIPSSLFLLPSPRKKKKKNLILGGDPEKSGYSLLISPHLSLFPFSLSSVECACAPLCVCVRSKTAASSNASFFFFYFKPLWRFLISELNMFLSSVVSEIFYLSLVSVAYSFFFFPRLFKYTSYLLRKFWSPTLFPHLLIGRL